MTHPLMKLRPFTVEELTWETHDIFTLRLTPDDPSDLFEFLPGQWIYLHLLNEDGSSWARAAFSIASAPEDSKEGIELGIKIYGDYTKRASMLVPGDKVHVQGPFGRFVLPEGESELVLFAGGIGLAPLLCMIRSLASRNSDANVTLIYSNKTIEDVAYREELESLRERLPNLSIAYFLSRQESLPEGIQAELGRFDSERFDRYIPDASKGAFFMCGSREFMDAIRKMLADRGVDVKARLKEELFG